MKGKMRGMRVMGNQGRESKINKGMGGRENYGMRSGGNELRKNRRSKGK